MKEQLPFQLLGTRILLTELEEAKKEEVTQGGIVVPVSVARQNKLNHTMRIVAVGEGVKDKRIFVGGQLEVNPHDLAIHKRIEHSHEKEYFIILEENIIGIY